MKNEDKVFLVVAIAAAGFIAYKATRKDDVVAAGGYANAVGRGGLANSDTRMGNVQGQTQARVGTVAPSPARPVPGRGGESAKPMWQKKMEKMIFFWRKDI